MANSTKLWILVVAAIVVGVIYVQQSKTSRMATTEPIWSGEKDDVQKVLIKKDGESLELVKLSGAWTISGHDSLTIRENRMDDLFNKVLAVNRTTVMTEKESRWSAYSVTDTLGTSLSVQDVGGNDLATFVFGQSRTDWRNGPSLTARCWVETITTTIRTNRQRSCVPSPPPADIPS